MTKRYWMTDGQRDLDVMVEEGVDMDGRFKAVCNDTGETLYVNGWLIEDIEEITA